MRLPAAGMLRGWARVSATELWGLALAVGSHAFPSGIYMQKRSIREHPMLLPNYQKQFGFAAQICFIFLSVLIYLSSREQLSWS